MVLHDGDILEFNIDSEKRLVSKDELQTAPYTRERNHESLLVTRCKARPAGLSKHKQIRLEFTFCRWEGIYNQPPNPLGEKRACKNRRRGRVGQ